MKALKKRIAKLTIFFLTSLCLLGTFSINALAVNGTVYIEPKTNIASAKTVYVPVKQTSTLNGSPCTYTFNLKAVKGRKVEGTASGTDGTTCDLTFSYNKKGLLTSYASSSNNYTTTYTYKSGFLAKQTSSQDDKTTYKLSNKKYTKSKVLKSATVTQTNSSVSLTSKETYYTSGKQKGLVKTSKLYRPEANGGLSLMLSYTYSYKVDSHGNVTKATITCKSTGSNTTSKEVITTKYKKLTLKK